MTITAPVPDQRVGVEFGGNGAPGAAREATPNDPTRQIATNAGAREAAMPDLARGLAVGVS